MSGHRHSTIEISPLILILFDATARIYLATCNLTMSGAVFGCKPHRGKVATAQQRLPLFYSHTNKPLPASTFS